MSTNNNNKYPPYFGLSFDKFAFGGISCMVPLLLMNPVEVVKIRLQIQGELSLVSERRYRGLLHGLWRVGNEEGVRGLYKGLTPALLREAVYASIRMGLYEPLKILFGETQQQQLPLYLKMACGAIAGGVGASIAAPTDVVKIQMQAEGPNEIPRYRNTAHAYSEIWKKEGMHGLFRGVIPTAQRAAIISSCMLPVYDHTKHFIIDKGWASTDDLKAHFISGLMAGFCMAVVSSPIDVIKTRIMNQGMGGLRTLGKDNLSGIKYSGSIDCLIKTVRTEGPLALYKGFVPNVMRIGPHTTLSFLILEQLRSFFGVKTI
eukprot:TRINITY_DN5086_c0_g1_i1.p1 TRINITY_DN5086_c0_g1~~TRINITY_DN5086_c0_g1_i1.p1  ORF type:complete len:317 (-),score=30.70 TRINITY_DN5086_c0_g1_i1:67-1017(-)